MFGQVMSGLWTAAAAALPRTRAHDEPPGASSAQAGADAACGPRPLLLHQAP